MAFPRGINRRSWSYRTFVEVVARVDTLSDSEVNLLHTVTITDDDGLRIVCKTEGPMRLWGVALWPHSVPPEYFGSTSVWNETALRHANPVQIAFDVLILWLGETHPSPMYTDPDSNGVRWLRGFGLPPGGG